MSAIKRNFSALNTNSALSAPLTTASKKKKLSKLDSSLSSTIRVYARFRAPPTNDSIEGKSNETFFHTHHLDRPLHPRFR